MDYRLNLQKSGEATAILLITRANSGQELRARESDTHLDFSVQDGETVTLKLWYGDRAFNVQQGKEYKFTGGQDTSGIAGLVCLNDVTPEPPPAPEPEPEPPAPEPEPEPPAPEPEPEPPAPEPDPEPKRFWQ